MILLVISTTYCLIALLFFCAVISGYLELKIVSRATGEEVTGRKYDKLVIVYSILWIYVLIQNIWWRCRDEFNFRYSKRD